MWAAPVWYVYDEDLTIYWWSPVESQHSRNIEKNQDVYITIFDSTAPEGDGFGLYVRAAASLVDESELEKAMSLYNDSTTVFKMNPENCSGNSPTRMYKAVPSKIWMNEDSTENGQFIDIRTETSIDELTS